MPPRHSRDMSCACGRAMDVIQMDADERQKLAKQVVQLIRENDEVQMAVINLVCSCPNEVTGI